MSTYAKAIYLFLSAVLAGALPLLSGHLTQAEGINFAILVAGALVTYIAPELPAVDASYTKTAIAALIAGLAVLSTFVHAGGSITAIPGVEWVQIIGAVVAVLLGPAHQMWFGTPQRAAA